MAGRARGSCLSRGVKREFGPERGGGSSNASHPTGSLRSHHAFTGPRDCCSTLAAPRAGQLSAREDDRMNDCGQTTGREYGRLVIRGATVIDGWATPAAGPMDLVIERGEIAGVYRVDPVSLGRYPAGWARPDGDHVLDATGLYALPGLVDMHAHVPPSGGKCGPCGSHYAYKLWLAHGVTTLRTVGWGNEDQLYHHRRESEMRPEMAVPRLVILHGFGWPRLDQLSPAEAREQVRTYRDLGADGVKVNSTETAPKVLASICDEAARLSMKAGVAVHLALSSEIDAVMASGFGVATIEHGYGIPEAAMAGVQDFPPDYNEMDELQRFRRSGYHWSEAEHAPERLDRVLNTMLENGTAWVPTMVVYEANRDLGRARTLEWNARHAVASLIDYWTPSPGVHASFHHDWRTSDEVAWKMDFGIWMRYLTRFFERGGLISTGTDAGSMYALYGFSMIRELELLQEAGFRPLDIVKMASTNAARINGLSGGGLRKGCPADIILVDGNPVENLKVMYGTCPGDSGGVRWTIRDGVMFDARALLEDVRSYVDSMR